MTELLDTLRYWAKNNGAPVWTEAIEEIERLRAEVNRLQALAWEYANKPTENRLNQREKNDGH